MQRTLLITLASGDVQDDEQAAASDGVSHAKMDCAAMAGGITRAGVETSETAVSVSVSNEQILEQVLLPRTPLGHEALLPHHALYVVTPP